MSQTNAHEITVEEVRRLAMPLSAHIIAGEGRLDGAVTWATVIHPEDDLASKSIQKHELILFAPVSNPSKARSDSELVRWSAEAQAAAVADMQRNAERMAELAGVKLGRLVFLSEAGYYPPPGYDRSVALGVEAASVLTPIVAGNLEINASVQGIYLIAGMDQGER